MTDERKKHVVISRALTRAMTYLPEYARHYLNKDGFSYSRAMEVARLVVRELDHAGWTLKDPSADAVRDLEDQICIGLSMADCSRLASQSPDWSKKAGEHATKCICAVMGFRKIVLVRRNGAVEP